MKRQYSIRTKVTSLFFIVFVLTCACFIISLTLESQERSQEQNLMYQESAKILLSKFLSDPEQNLSKLLLDNGFSYAESSRLKAIKNEGIELSRIKGDEGEFITYLYNQRFYLELSDENQSFLFQAGIESTTLEFMFLGFLASLSLAVILYFSIINSLSPLEKLRKEVAEASLNQNFIAKGYNNDEIGKIAFEFENSMRKNQELIRSRQLFLRTIMHELKTPIGKGRIIAEMMREEKQKERLILIFERLNLLINEAARIESLLTKNYYLSIRPYAFSEILAQAKEYLILDSKDHLQVNIIEDGIFNVDLEVFALMLKNLMDNAFKYSSDHFCIISSYDDKIIVKNKGEPLKKEFKEYTKAFVREKHENTEGMGLGLYIIESICKMHNFILEYKYEQGYHIFSVIKSVENAA